MSFSIDKLIETARKENGYLEKSKAAYEKNPAVLDSKTDGAGSDNYTKYGRDMKKIDSSVYGVNYQWCDQFVDWCFVQAFGKDNAKKLLGGWSAYTPSSAGFFKNMKQWHSGKDIQRGDVIFFKNSTRICHTGIVTKYDKVNGVVYTIEGNTSAGDAVVSNGGGVAEKCYKDSNTRIAGYGRPAYGEQEVKTVEDVSKVGWHKDNTGWWYRHTAGTGTDTYYHSIIKEINGVCYAFNKNGYLIMKTPSKIGIDSNGGLYVID